MTLLIEAKLFRLRRMSHSSSLAYIEFDDRIQREWRRVGLLQVPDVYTLFVSSNYCEEFREYTLPRTFEHDYASSEFWAESWPLISEGFNELLEKGEEDIVLEIPPLIPPSWVVGNSVSIALPSGFDE